MIKRRLANMYPRQLENLIFALQRLPGVGAKSAERYAFTILDWSKEKRKELIDALKGIDEIHSCEICGNLSEDKICAICANESRNKNTICVVAYPKDIVAIENMQAYDGVYHVLNGLINTAKGTLPEMLNIDSLLKRINKDTEEVILALDPTIEGETTALYLEKLLENHVKVSKLAYGIPVGGHLDYADTRTLAKAFEGRIHNK